MNASTPDQDLGHLINKEVRAYTAGKDLTFSLSMGLFSSNSIDVGTRLLIDTLLEHVEMKQVSTILDAGCGTGVIGITLASLDSRPEVTCCDRDALALSFTNLNSTRNSVIIRTCPSLDVLSLSCDFAADRLFTSAGDLQYDLRRYDLIVTNIPAKAGAGVLKRFFSNGLALLEPGGRFAVVIVDTLRTFASQLIPELGATCIHRTDGPRHSVFIISRGKEYRGQVDSCFPGPYRRQEALVTYGKVSYELTTVYDLPEFDSLGFATRLQIKSTGDREFEHLAIYNPGQGHSALHYLYSNPTLPKHLSLFSRDLLSLCITEYNVRKHFPQLSVSIAHVASLEQLKIDPDAGRTLLLLFPEAIPRVSVNDRLSRSAWLETENLQEFVITAESSGLSGLSRRLGGFQLSGSKKHKGFRSMTFGRLYI